MKIRSDYYALPMDDAFIDILTHQLNQHPPPHDHWSFVVLNFRDPDYSPQKGGFHPVEVGISDQGAITYVTEFAYVGCGQNTELAKELDFEFMAGVLQQQGREFAIEQAVELFQIWQQNFCHYYNSGTYRVTVLYH